MNPLFIAHLTADFLLQPNWLEQWKKKSIAGIIVHAAIHAAVMALFLTPQNWPSILAIAAIAVLHGIIDKFKINFNKKYEKFSAPFLVDQLAHGIILTILTLLLPSTLFWHSEMGAILLITFLYFSFGVGAWNLAKNQTQKLERVSVIAIVFAFYAILAVMF